MRRLIICQKKTNRDLALVYELKLLKKTGISLSARNTYSAKYIRTTNIISSL